MGTASGERGECDKVFEWYQQALGGCEKVLAKTTPTPTSPVIVWLAFSNPEGSTKRRSNGINTFLTAKRKASAKTTSTLSRRWQRCLRCKRYEKALQWHQRALGSR